MKFRELQRQSEIDKQHMKSEINDSYSYSFTEITSKAESINSVEQSSHELLTILNEQLKGDIDDDDITSNEQYLIENEQQTFERDLAGNKFDESNISVSNTDMKSLKSSKGKNLTNFNQHLEETGVDANGNDYSMTYADDPHIIQSNKLATDNSRVIIKKSSKQINDDFSKEYHATEEGNYSG